MCAPPMPADAGLDMNRLDTQAAYLYAWKAQGIAGPKHGKPGVCVAPVRPQFELVRVRLPCLAYIAAFVA